MTVRRLILHPLWLFLALPGYIGWRVSSGLNFGPVWIGAGIALLIGCCLFIRFSMRTRALQNRKLADRIAWVGLTAMGFFSSLFVFTLLRDVLLLGAHLFLSSVQAQLWNERSAQMTLYLALFVTLAGMVIARRRPGIVEIKIPVVDLPHALHGFSIAQISDVHVGPTIKRGFVEGIVRLVNDLKVDLIAVTGDLVDGSVQQLSAHTAPLAGLTARHGAYFVTGNHEYYSGERAWTEEIRRLGLRVLKNEHVVLKHDGASLVLAGVTDYSAHHFDPAQRSDPAAALRSARARRCRRKSFVGTPTEFSDGGRRGGLRCTNLGPHTWRPVLAMELVHPFFPAVFQRPASLEEFVGLRQPRHRLPGPAESLRRSIGNYTDSIGTRGSLRSCGEMGAVRPRR